MEKRRTAWVGLCRNGRRKEWEFERIKKKEGKLVELKGLRTLEMIDG